MGVGTVGKRVASNLTALVYGAGILVAMYLVAAIAGERAREMVFQRGMIPHIIMAASSLAFGLLAQKLLELRRSEGHLAQISGVFAQNLGALGQFMDSSPVDASATATAMQFFPNLPQCKETERITALLRDSKENDGEFAMKRFEMTLTLEAEASDNWFRSPQVLAWIVPMLGFLGTVWGISISLANFTAVMGNVDNISQIKKGLGMITAGLGIAFDTTILGLVFAILITGGVTLLQRKENALLDLLERTGLDIMKALSRADAERKARVEDETRKKGTEALIDATVAITRATRGLGGFAEQLQRTETLLVAPSPDLKNSFLELQKYVKYFAFIAKQSNALVEERSALEAAANSISELRHFSNSLDKLSAASRDLLFAVQILRNPREFTLIERVRDGGADPHE